MFSAGVVAEPNYSKDFLHRKVVRVVSLGRPAHFCFPSAKWDNEEFTFRKKTVRVLVHEFLVGNYDGYTVRGPFQGTWRPSRAVPCVQEPVIEVKVSFRGKERIPKLQKFLAAMCSLLKEECLYLEMGECSYLIYP